MTRRVNKPNILLIMADQLAPQFLPCYGHKVVKAPTLTKLADEGVVFESAYTNSPLCAPSRFVMMSGRLPSKLALGIMQLSFPQKCQPIRIIYLLKAIELASAAKCILLVPINCTAIKIA